MDINVEELLRQRSTSKFMQKERGDVVISPQLPPCRLKILFVVDGYPGSFFNISFSHSYFDLSTVLDTLRNNPEYFVKFDVTRAHRQIDDDKPDPDGPFEQHEFYAPHYENFRFDQPDFDINEYDQVWLFGIRAELDFSGEPDPERLTDAELLILAQWMDNGGGLFAAGDHDDLGASLCARVPRVRSMRKWTFSQGTPPPVGPTRHDSLDKGHDAVYTFDDESDDKPMSILPKYYELPSWSPFNRLKVPHPLLCGSGGVIDILPDHPHEGEVIPEDSIDVAATFSVGDYSTDEYPAVEGVQPTPEVIAWATVQPDHTDITDLNKAAANFKVYGAIGAYEGHDAEVGRVAVDSTWHYWFDVNLTGRPTGSLDTPPFDITNVKTLGFLATDAGRTALARIREYYRNTAIWLASAPKQRSMFLRAIWGAVLRYPAVERLNVDLPLWELGSHMRSVLSQRANQCLVTRWLIDIYPVKLFDTFKAMGPQPDTRLTSPPWEAVETYILGGITRELLRRMYEHERAFADLGEETLAAALVEGANAGTRELLDSLETSMRDTQGMVDNLSELMDQSRRSARDYMEQ